MTHDYVPHSQNTDDLAGPINGGANFVDAELQVVVVGAAGTLMAHRADHMHGTTKACGAVNDGFTIACSRRLEKAWLDMTSIEVIDDGN